MALTYTEGTKNSKEIPLNTGVSGDNTAYQKDKIKAIEVFSKELEPIMNSLNGLLAKYNLDKTVISFNWMDGKVQPFTSYTAFPCSSTTAGQLI